MTANCYSLATVRRDIGKFYYEKFAFTVVFLDFRRLVLLAGLTILTPMLINFIGVILYMLVCGVAPFNEANDSETLTNIMDCRYKVLDHVSEECQDLIRKMLIR